MQIRRFFWIACIAAFFLSLFLVELGPYSASQVARYNEGYGTFDMKSYDCSDVAYVLSHMDAKGIAVYQCYYGFDTLFLLCFGLLQVLISIRFWKSNCVFSLLLLLISLMRGLLDLLENGILLHSISSYPNLNHGLITTASFFTKLKLLCIPLWLMLLATAVLYRRIRH